MTIIAKDKMQNTCKQLYTFMATTKLYLDTRSRYKNGEHPLKIAIHKKGKTSLLSIGVSLLPSQWDKGKEQVIMHNGKRYLNSFITRRKLEVDTIILQLSENPETYNMTAQQIKEYIVSKLSGESIKKITFVKYYEKCMKSKNESTKKIYEYTLGRIRAFSGNDFENVYFEDITKSWLTRFENFLSQTSVKNSINISLRNIRSVFNDAIDDEITSFYPFRRYPIKPIATSKRSLKLEEIALLFNQNDNEYLDMFKLSFYLIGINIIDMYNLITLTDDGRIEYNRKKTKRFYSIKVEPEALEIIKKYQGKDYLLNIKERCKNHKNYIHRINENLQLIGPYKKQGRGGKRIRNPLFPKITTYWARHTWATIAAELDIPKETIAASLGHSIGNPTTSIYIDFNIEKIDKANRMVIDVVNKKQELLRREN